jgi:hypothetical protein
LLRLCRQRVEESMRNRKEKEIVKGKNAGHSKEKWER